MSTPSSRPAVVEDLRLPVYDDLRNVVYSLEIGDQLTIETSDIRAVIENRRSKHRSVKTLRYLSPVRVVRYQTLVLSNSTDELHILPDEHYPVFEDTPLRVRDWMERVSILVPPFMVQGVLEEPYQWAQVPIYNFPQRLRVEFARPRLLGFVSFKLTQTTGERVLRRPLFASANPAIAVTRKGDEFIREAEGWVPRYPFLVTEVPGTSVFVKGAS